jgi:DNA-binding NtrC family response regulator
MALILVVDDEPGIRGVLTRWIQAAGHETCEAGDADQALDAMAARSAAVAFCDVQMPGHDGLWLTRQLRQRYPLAAIILATGESTVPPAVSMQCGVLAYLVKPFNGEAVRNALETALAWHEEALLTGPPPDDTGERLNRWLETLED